MSRKNGNSKGNSKTNKVMTGTAIGVAAAVLMIGGVAAAERIVDNQELKEATIKTATATKADVDTAITSYNTDAPTVNKVAIDDEEKEALKNEVQRLVTPELMKTVADGDQAALSQLESEIARIVKANTHVSKEDAQALTQLISAVIESEMYQYLADNYASIEDLEALRVQVDKNTADILNLANKTDAQLTDVNNKISGLQINLSNAISQIKMAQEDTTAFEGFKSDVQSLLSALQQNFDSKYAVMEESMAKESAEKSALLASETAARIAADKAEEKARTEADALINERLRTLTEDTIVSLRDDLQNEIDTNADLSKKEREKLQNAIDILDAKTEDSIASTRTELEKIINEKDAAQSKALSTEVDIMTTKLNSTEASLREELSCLRQDLTRLTEETITNLRNDLQSEIDANAELSQDERFKLQDAINKLDTKTTNSLEDAKKELSKIISENDAAQTQALNEAVDNQNQALNTAVNNQNQALNTAVNNIISRLDTTEEALKTDIKELQRITSESITDLQKDLQAQLDANKELTEKERAELQNAIDSLDTQTTRSLENARTSLNKLIQDKDNSQSVALTNAVNNMTSKINGTQESLAAQIQGIKTDLSNLAKRVSAVENQLKDGDKKFQYSYDEESGAYGYIIDGSFYPF